MSKAFLRSRTRGRLDYRARVCRCVQSLSLGHLGKSNRRRAQIPPLVAHRAFQFLSHLAVYDAAPRGQVFPELRYSPGVMAVCRLKARTNELSDL